MKYIIVDTETYGKEFDTREEAINEAFREWDYLTASEKKQRSIWVLESVNPDEEAENHFDGDPVMFRVELRHWKAGSGYSHNETFDNIDKVITAREYWDGIDPEIEIKPDEGINVEIYDEEDNLLSEWFVEGE